MKEVKKKLVIIGAGPAGLTAAYEMLRNSKEYEVTILEAEDMVGGISKTITFDGYKVDTGIHRFFTKNDEIKQIWEELLPLQNKPAYDEIKLNRTRNYQLHGSDPEKEDKLMLIKDRVTRIYYGKKFYDYPVSLNFVTLKNLGFVNIIKVGVSYLKACLIKKEETSLENFFINRFGKVLYSMFFEDYTKKVWGRHPRDISADWGEQRVKGISIFEVLKDGIYKILGKKNAKNTETSLIEQFVYPKLGAGQIWEEMAKRIQDLGGIILLNAKVKKIMVKENKIVQLQYERKGQNIMIDVDKCISSMPLKDLVAGIENEKVPEEIKVIANGLPYRNFMSVCMVVDKLNLKNNTDIKTLGNIVPDDWIYMQEPEVKMGRMQIFNNWSPYLFKNKEEMENKVLIGLEYFCSEDDQYWRMSDENFIEFAKEEAEKIGIIDKNNIEKAIRIKIPKAYPAYFDTYVKIDKLIEYVNHFENLYCIGRNGQHRYNNMDHSMLTAIETVKNIIEGEKSKKNIWNVNTEKKYHEKN